MSRKRRANSVEGPDAHEDISSTKRRRQYTEQDSKLAKLYENLAHEVTNVRIQAAKELVLELAPDKYPSVETVQKVVVRLIRGLCSSRKAARLGFFVALAEILRQLFNAQNESNLHKDFKVDRVLDMVDQYTQPEGKAAGQERKDHLFGRLSGYAALIESSVLFRPEVPIECWTKTLDLMCKLARTKPWLREECGKIMYESVKRLGLKPSNQIYVEGMIESLRSNGLLRTPEGVAVWLAVCSDMPKLELPDGIWHHKDPLCTKERQSLASVMRESNVQDSEDASKSNNRLKSGSSQSKVNFAWDVVIASFIEKKTKRKLGGSQPDPSEFSQFWIDVVDNNLFAASASLERKSWGLQLFAKVISTAPEWVLRTIFSLNLMRCLINHRVDTERYLHDAAKTPLEAMRARVKKEPDLAAAMLSGLISQNGAINFDHITKSKVIDSILSAASPSALVNIVSQFRDMILHPNTEDRQTADSQRRMLADMLISAVRSRNKQQTDAANLDAVKRWLEQLLLVFVQFAYTVPDSATRDDTVPRPPISDASRAMFQSRLSSALAHILSARLDEEITLPYAVASALRSQAESSGMSGLTLQANKQVWRTLKRAHKTLGKVASQERAANEKEKPTLRAFKLLYSITVLQVYNADPDAVSVLDELDECYASVAQHTGVQTHAFGLLIEVILGSVSRPSALFRKLAEQVFTAFASEVTTQSLQSMIDILNKKESLAGQQDLFDQADEDGDEGDEDSGEEALDVETLSGSPVTSTEDESSSGEEEDTSEDGQESDASLDGDDDQEDGEETKKFDALLAETLKTSQPDGNASNKEESSDDEDMDDEQMMALDPHLEKILGERKKITSKKKESQDAKETVINFKNRVLDLLSIYVKQQHANTLAMDLILPLLRLIRSSSSQQVAQKAFNLLKQYFDACKGKDMPTPTDLDATWKLLGDIHVEGTRDAPKFHGAACSRSSLFVVKTLVYIDRSNYDRAVDIYSDTQKQWFRNPKSRVQPALFSDWINWSIATRKPQ